MSSSLLELRWYVDSHGYDLLDGQHSHQQGSGAGPASSAILTPTVLEKMAAFFRLGDDSRRVVPRGGPPKPYRREADDLDILYDLLNMPDTSDGVLDFVSKWGLLGDPSRYRSVTELIANKALLVLLLRPSRRLRIKDLVLASLDLVQGPTGGLSLRANTLGDFLWAQASQLRFGAFFQCPVCKKFALASATGRPPKYCSDACSSKAYRDGLTARRV